MTDEQLRVQFCFIQGILKPGKLWLDTPSFTVWLNLMGLMETWYFVTHNNQ